ncbi:hypothetical protein DSM106972_015940 [Dulcicalothrix desertica PCC 7102]|uniref:Uncharacterized protein n=1 Tax=Dulcicalothrix desertica PCC 7102 TaxID=232991 RepID=A0A3S1CQB7_9CYAN|nr:hypothetical protein [Dulcicalothrix desertica]RUT08426.1 hypothetical protein DSM106972_015940 [Dulcicalothrix desertica PCC 7102]TWH40291.1 hypothetical protein CAL7102_09598 [Dulcicalothrix desertica PCC 7102]
MAECKDIDKALRDLSGKIDGFKDKLKNLDDKTNDALKCCKDKTKQEEGKGDNLADILRRLAKLERDFNSLKQQEENHYKTTTDIAEALVNFKPFLEVMNKFVNLDFSI